MSKTIKEEHFRWVLPIVKKGIRLVDAAKVCPYGKRSLERWVAAYQAGGEKALEPKSTEPKSYQRETPIWLKEKVVGIRKETKRCALKIHWQLEKEGIRIDIRTIGKVLKKEGLVRKYRVKRTRYISKSSPNSENSEMFGDDISESNSAPVRRCHLRIHLQIWRCQNFF